MNRSLMLFWLLVFLRVLECPGQDAPVITGSDEATFDDHAAVMIRVSGFSSIASFGLHILYDPSIADVVSVTNTQALGGNLAVNTGVPGNIIIGWYTFPAISLPDSTVILEMTFSKAATGTTAIEFSDEGLSCYFSNNDGAILNDLPTSTYYNNGSVTFNSYAPVAILPVLSRTPDQIVDLPVIVNGFREIGKFKMTMKYDPAILTFQGWSNTSGFPGMVVNSVTSGELVCEGVVDEGENGLSLQDSSVLYNLQFIYSGGSTALTWITNHDSCNYYASPPVFASLYDDPAEHFYFNGQISQSVGLVKKSLENHEILISPNPLHGTGNISFYADETGKATVVVCDASGRSVFSLSEAIERPGCQSFLIDSSLWPEGFYTLTIIINSFESTDYYSTSFIITN